MPPQEVVVEDSVRPPSLEEIAELRLRMGQRIRETPVWQWQGQEAEARLGDTEVLLKLELFQFAGSFKVRGALASMLELEPDALARGVTAVSAGNHAIAVAHTARVLGTRAKVVMLASANPARRKACERLGAELVIAEDVHRAFDEVHRIEREEGLTFVHPFEGPAVVRGTATLGYELARSARQLDAVVIPIGGGGLCAGVAAAVKAMQPHCRVYGVEPEGADSMHRSFASGRPESIEKVRTIADSLGAPYALPYTFALCRRFVDRLVLVDDEALCRAMLLLFRELKLAVEPAGAATTAALLGPLREELRGKRVALVVCGTNIDPDTFHRCLERGAAGERS